MTEIMKLLEFAVRQKASDLHLSAGVPPILRIKGEVKQIHDKVVSPSVLESILQEIMTTKQYDTFLEKAELDFSLDIPNLSRFRINAFNQSRGYSAVFRVISSVIPTLDQLKLPETLKSLCMSERGLILVTGPTGSGKSTTLAAMINHINENRLAHIVTIEDPIEFVHTNKKCLINHREVGTHTHSFANALKSALREDPDIILLGELRDLETIELAITAAETGHLVFATLHTNTAPKAIDRVISVFPAYQQPQIRTMLSESLRAVIAQELLPRADTRGRVAALEILINVVAVRNTIRENKIFQIPTIIQTSTAIGMQSMEQVLKQLAMKNIITPKMAEKKIRALH